MLMFYTISCNFPIITGTHVHCIHVAYSYIGDCEDMFWS